MVTKKSIEKISENEEITTAKICRKATLKFKNSFHEFSNPQKIYYLLFFLSQEETGLIKEIVLCFILNFKKKFQFLLLKRRAFGKSRGEEK